MKVNGANIITLQEIVGLGTLAEKDPIAKEQYNEALYGGYMLTRDQAAENVNRKLSGSHLPDSQVGLWYLDLPSGKLPWHPTFSNESPYANGLSSTSAGEWEKKSDGWQYSPSQGQFNRDINYQDKLYEYFKHNQGTNDEQTNSIKLPSGKIINNPEELIIKIK